MSDENVFPLPLSSRPVDAIAHVTAEAGDPRLETVVVILIRKDEDPEIAQFGAARVRDLVFAASKLAHLVLESTNDQE